MPCGHDRRPAEQRLCCCGERRPCVRRGAWECGRAAGSGEWRRAPGLQVARKCAALCLLQLQCERRRDNDRGAPVRHAREPVLGEGGDWHPLGTAYSFNTRLSTWFSRHRGPKGVWRGTSTKDGSKPGQPSTQRASTIRVLKRTSLPSATIGARWCTNIGFAFNSSVLDQALPKGGHYSRSTTVLAL